MNLLKTSRDAGTFRIHSMECAREGGSEAMVTLQQLIGRDGRVGPWRFLAWGAWLFALKFLLDRVIATLVFERDWSPANYLIPNESYSLFAMPPGDRGFYFVMLLVALPFVAVGVTLTFRRLRDAALPRWLVVLFFVPFVNLLFFGALSIVHSGRSRKPDSDTLVPFAHFAPRASPEPVDETLAYGHDERNSFQRFCARLLPESAAKSRWVAVLLPVPCTLAIVFFAAIVLQDYGWGVFVGLPFFVGIVAPILHGYSVPRSFGQSVSVSFSAALVSGLAVLLSALEGAVCLIMLAPLAAPIVLMGAAMGHAIQSRPERGPGMSNTLWGMLVLLPVLIGAESRLPRKPSLHCTVTTVDVDAAPMQV
ncbi:MAG: DUF805 domain-containing protein, partial [Chthoniobacterales bacterium]|nr:DUF805 domain-containing protein [Chthoniobacterales bacterium]